VTWGSETTAAVDTDAVVTTAEQVEPVDPNANAETTAEAKTEDAEKKEKWGYPARNNVWGGACQTGKQQSPIDLPPMTAAEEQYALTEYMQYRKITMRGEDTGTGLSWSPKKGQASMGYFTFESVKYNLNSWQIHAGSEHTVNGKQYDMEVQFNHKSEAGAEAIISVMCAVMPLTEPSPFFTKLQVAMSADTEIDPAALFENSMDTTKYFQYTGSKTTPPCEEGVTWIVLATVCSIPDDFYKYATGLPSMKDNYRSPQALNKRAITTKTAHLNDHWHYPARNEDWGGVCNTGRQQSPIDLPLTVLSAITAKSALLEQMKYEPVGYKGSDSGHGLKWVSDKEMGHLEYNGKQYKLLQINIHAKSEHTIAGQQYDLEIHFQHKSDDDEYAIVAILCSSENFGQSTFFDNLQASMLADVKIDMKKDFLSTMDTRRYFTYPGSLTTPPCTEGVEWIVLAANVKVPKDFLIFLKKYKTMKNNFREPQPLMDRSVETVELEEAAGDMDEEDEEHIDLAEIPFAAKLGIGAGVLGVCGLFVLFYRCQSKHQFNVALLHDDDEV